MSTLIATDVAGQAVDSSIIDLFELTLPNQTILYFHSGVDSDLTNIQFRQSDPNPANGVYTAQTYIPIPVMLDGLDFQADGAANRPSLTVANVSNFSDQLSNFKNDDLVGQTLTRRRTLQKYLVGESADSSPPIEFKKAVYKIDRVGVESALSVTFECALPYDLEGVKLPRRTIVGKYCSWQYKGRSLATPKGACTWPADGIRSYSTDNSTQTEHAYFFDIKDRPFVLQSWLSSGSNAAVHSTSTAYTLTSYVFKNHTVDGVTYKRYFQCVTAHTNQDPIADVTAAYWKEAFPFTDWVVAGSPASYLQPAISSAGETLLYTGNALGTTFVRRHNTIWQCTTSHTANAGKEPPNPALLNTGSIYWVQAELCGKTLQSCKCRFQAIPASTSADNQAPSGEKNTNIILPFGAFPGSSKY